MKKLKKITVHTEKATITSKQLDDPVIIKYPQIILGIHANAAAVEGYSQPDGCRIQHGKMEGAPCTEIKSPRPDRGHIWLTVERVGGEMVTYGLWKDGYVNEDKTVKVEDNGPDSDIRVEIDKQTRPYDPKKKGIGKVHRYYLLSIEQEQLLHDLLHNNVTYTAGWLDPSGYQCATWAADVVETVVGESFRPDQYGYPYQYSADKNRGIVSPRIVAAMIKSYEGREETINNSTDAKQGTKPSKNPPRIPAPPEKIESDPVAIGTP